LKTLFLAGFPQNEAHSSRSINKTVFQCKNILKTLTQNIMNASVVECFSETLQVDEISPRVCKIIELNVPITKKKHLAFLKQFIMFRENLEIT